MWKDVDGEIIYFVYSDEGLVGEYDEAGTEIKSYGYAPGSTYSTNPLFQKINGNYYWYINDHNGTPQKLIGVNGLVVWSGTYDSFGNCTVVIDGIENNLRFPGQYYDAETGLHYNLNRYYDPQTGRYLRTDPYGDGLNLYAYCYNNPINFMDPQGLCVLRIAGGVLEIIAAVAAIPASGGLGTVAAILVIANGLDNIYAGTMGLISGEYKQALLEQLIYEFVPEGAAPWVYTATQVLIPAGGLAVAQRSTRAVTEGLESSSRSVVHGPMNPGPLAEDIANTFRSGTYTARTLDESTTLYRVIGDTGNPAGSYWTRVKPQGPLQSTIDSALDQNWGNTATRVVEARIPTGTQIYEGAAAAQRGLVGGGNQIYIPKVDPKWIVP